jgi:cellulose synthase (UDP-forming)
LIGVAYHLNSTKEERIAVDIAFGSSEQIKKIIARRHKAQSHIQGLRNIIYYALHHGLGHLRFLTANLYKKITQLLNLKNRRINA